MSSSASPAAPASPSPAAQRVAAVERTLAQLQAAQADFATNVNGELQRIGIRMQNFESTLRQREEEIKAALDATAAQRSAELAAVVADATSEFNTQRGSIQAMAAVMEQEFQRIGIRMQNFESTLRQREEEIKAALLCNRCRKECRIGCCGRRRNFRV